jgi:PAS domain-containing protein
VAPDDLTIDDTTLIYRLLNPDFDVAWDEDDGRWIVRSRAFQNSTGTDRMSVVLGDRMEEDDRPPEDACRTKPDWYVVSLVARQVRDEEQEIERDSLQEEPAHGNVVGSKPRNRRKRFAEVAEWVVMPPPRETET